MSRRSQSDNPTTSSEETYRNLLAQELQVLITISQTQLRRRKLLLQHSLSLLKRVGQHNISTKPEVHLLGISRRDRSTSVEGIIEFKVGLEFGIGIGLARINTLLLLTL